MNRLKLWTLLICIAALSCAVPVSIPVDPAAMIQVPKSEKAISVSTGRAELVPDRPVPMAGYGTRYKKKSKGVHDPIFARCIMIRQGDKRMAIVGSDLLIMTAQLRLAVLDKIKDLDLDALMLTATHSHSGPGGYVHSFAWEVAAMGTYEPELFDFIAKAIAKSIRNAYDAPAFEAKIGAGQAAVPDYVANRRHDGGETDPALSIIRMDDLEGKPRVLILSYGAHPTVMLGSNRLISGDYVGEFERLLEEKVDMALFLPSDIGDQKPHLPNLERDPYTFEHIKEMGRGLAEAAWKLAQNITTGKATLAVVEQQIELPEGDLNKACFGFMHAPLENRAKRILQKSTLFQAWRIGDALILASPGELGHEIGLDFRSRFPDNIVLPTSHANDYVGYVISPEEYARGGYESCMNFYGPDFALTLVETLSAMGNMVK